jgi:predicted site-specific integrase-resolvase
MAKVFRTPEERAPEIGVPPSTLRRFIRESGICTRLERNRITLTDDDAERLVAWIKEQSAPTPEEHELDPFAS